MFSDDLEQLNSAHQRSVIPALFLIDQSSHKSDAYEDPDFDVPVRIVVKNAPFRLKIGTFDRASKRVGLIDLHQVRFDLGLVYAVPSSGELGSSVDFGEEEREKVVVPPGFEPLITKVDISERGDEASVDCRIRVLTSQHEQSLFQISISAVNPETGQSFTPPLHFLTDPIKVISKPEQQKPPPSAALKGVSSEKLAEVVSRIERQQMEQAKLLQQLLDSKSLPSSSHRSSSSLSISHPSHSSSHLSHPSNLLSHPNSSAASASSLSLPPDPRLSSSSSHDELLPLKTPESAFEEAFSQFVDTFISSSSKPDTVRQLLKTSNPSLLRDFSGFLEDLHSATDAHRKMVMDDPPPGFLPDSANQCSCGSRCPFSKELERVDVYYRDFLSSDLMRFDA